MIGGGRSPRRVSPDASASASARTDGHELLVELTLASTVLAAQNVAHAVAHSKRWIVDRATLRQARSDDVLYLDDPDLLGFFASQRVQDRLRRAPSALRPLLPVFCLRWPALCLHVTRRVSRS